MSIARSGDQEAPEERDLARPGRGAHAGSNSSEGLAVQGQGSHLSAGGGVARQRDHEVWPHLIPLVVQKRPNIRIFCQPQEGQIPFGACCPATTCSASPQLRQVRGFPTPFHGWHSRPDDMPLRGPRAQPPGPHASPTGPSAREKLVDGGRAGPSRVSPAGLAQRSFCHCSPFLQTTPSCETLSWEFSGHPGVGSKHSKC